MPTLRCCHTEGGPVMPARLRGRRCPAVGRVTSDRTCRTSWTQRPPPEGVVVRVWPLGRMATRSRTSRPGARLVGPLAHLYLNAVAAAGAHLLSLCRTPAGSDGVARGGGARDVDAQADSWGRVRHLNRHGRRGSSASRRCRRSGADRRQAGAPDGQRDLAREGVLRGPGHRAAVVRAPGRRQARGGRPCREARRRLLDRPARTDDVRSAGRGLAGLARSPGGAQPGDHAVPPGHARDPGDRGAPDLRDLGGRRRAGDVGADGPWAGDGDAASGAVDVAAGVSLRDPRPAALGERRADGGPAARRDQARAALAAARAARLAGDGGAAAVPAGGAVPRDHGCRFSEMAALRVDDVVRTPHGLGVRVHRAATQSKRTSGAVFGPTKTHQTRTVPVPAALDEYVRTRVAFTAPGGYLFPSPTGGVWTSTNFRARSGWMEATRRAGVEGTTIHDPRHTAASLLIAAGADVKAVQVILGHSTATMTMDLDGTCSERRPGRRWNGCR